MRFKDKVAIVTGAGSGMGREEAMVLAREGAAVVIAEINEANGQKVAKEIEDFGGKVLALQVDVSQSKDIEEMAKMTLDKFGRMDILVVNAGIEEPFGPTHELTETSWDRMTDVHLKGTFLCCKAVLPQMIKQRSGKIVTISSVGVKLRAPGSPHYLASKAGIEALTKTLA